MKKAIALALALAATSSFAQYSINWEVGYGIYPYDAPDLTAFDPGTGVAANNDVLWQLLWSPSGTIAPPDLGNAAGGYVSGDNQIFDSRTTLAGGSVSDGAFFDEWLYSLDPLQLAQGPESGGSVFVRIFGSTDPAQDMMTLGYYDMLDTAFQPLLLVPNPQDAPQSIVIGSVSEGLALERIPEPSTMALIALGMVGLAVRRRKIC